jgi:hypothetical protein
MPGEVAGDGSQNFTWGKRIEGVRDGHGYVYLEGKWGRRSELRATK